jgi:flagellar biosynthesis component FlhA
LVKPFVNRNGELPAYFLESGLERSIETAVEHGEQTSHLNAPPEAIRQVVQAVERSIPKPEAPVALITGSACRYFMRQMLENAAPNLFVLAHNEIPPEQKVVSLGIAQ